MKKYKTTKKHPELAKGIIIEKDKKNPRDYFANLSNKTAFYLLDDDDFNEQLKKGWIKQIKEKVWIIDTLNNWKLKKVNSDYMCIKEEKRFKQRQKALEFILDEAKKRFKIGLKFKQIDYDEIRDIDKEPVISEQVILIHGYYLWRPGVGWIAEPIEEKKLTKKEAFTFAKFYAAKIIQATVRPDIEKLFEDWES